MRILTVEDDQRLARQSKLPDSFQVVRSLERSAEKNRHADPSRACREALMRRHLLSLGAVLTLGGGIAAAQNTPPIAVTRSTAAIVLDGRLDEPVWRAAAAVKLIQQSPRPGEPTPYTTEVRVVLAGDRLYFGFICHDPEPRKIAVHSMQRDDPMTGDDNVSIALDTYGDKRTGYFFQVNAAGARTDGLISGPDGPAYEWDGIWDARTVRLADGWSAEMEIPARTLSFAPGRNEWGLNMERFVPRAGRITLRWASPTLDSSFGDMSRAGSMTGLGELQQGLGIEISPFTIGRIKDEFSRSPRAWQGSAGVDLTWKITPQLVTAFTANTDFAETEVDSRQINITRFPLFFPEKRSFFLEGANQYVFGLGLGESFIPFFSRQIGLLNGQPIPIDAGVKLNGRVGKWNLALLDVETRQTQTSTGPLAGVNLLAGRISYDWSDALRVGAIFTNGDPQGLKRNTLVGFDAVWRTSKFRRNKNLLASVWAVKTAGDLGPGSRAGWGATVEYPNDLWNCNGTLKDFGTALRPALGFLPRPGTRQEDVYCALQPRPSKSGLLRWMRQEFLENEFSRVVNARGITESWQYFLAPVNVRMETADRFEFNYIPEYEYLAAPFEIVPGTVIPPGAYRFTRFRVEAQSSPHRAVEAGSTTRFGTFYSGTLTQWEHYIKWTAPKAKVHFELTTENNFGHLKQGNFVQRLWQLQSSYAWNPNLVLTNFIQYDTDSQNVGSNTRLRWTIRPGNDLFIVWNRRWQRLILAPGDLSLVPDSELLAVKLRWTFRR
jgi:hypothetical protein